MAMAMKKSAASVVLASAGNRPKPKPMEKVPVIRRGAPRGR